jgi:hypothetical protein
MVDVQFNEEQTEIYRSRRILGDEVVPGMVNALTKTGIVKSGKHAEYVLFGIIGAALLGSGFFLYIAFRSPAAPPASELRMATPPTTPNTLVQ